MSQEAFDQIASGWYGFRHRTIFRSELEALSVRWQTGRLLNIGCGHGPDFIPFKNNFDLYGIDYSIEMLKLGKKYSVKYGFSPHLVLANACYLPFRKETFDVAISVAAYHHLRSLQERLSALAELYRVLKPGGEGFITVWNYWQPRFWLGRRNVMVPWRIANNIVYRYYHLFSYGELEKLVKQSGFYIIRSLPESHYHLPIKYFSRNICLLLRKSSKQ